MMAFSFFCLLASTCVHAARVRMEDADRILQDKHNSTDDHESADLSMGMAQAGQVLRDRYRLDHFMQRRSKGVPGQSFPQISSTRRQFNRVGPSDHLGTGSFGDVWKAYDLQLRREVAVKIFYQGNRYMTWRNANEQGLNELRESAGECNLVKQILSPSNRALYPVGASRICECYEQYIDDAKGTDNVVFLVQEQCGGNLQSAVIEERRKSGRMNYIKARQATKQMLQAIAYLQMFDPPLIHHDLKPANVCMNDRQEIKVIDWGGLVFGKYSNMRQPAVATPLFTPPEAASRMQSFSDPWWSYDDYALGLMHMMLVCPLVDERDWYYQRPLQRHGIQYAMTRACSAALNQMYSGGSDSLSQDLDLISALTNPVPGNRPHPMKLLDHEALLHIEVPRIQQDQAANLLTFKYGDNIEYWSDIRGQWVPGKVSRADHVNGAYDLVYMDGRPMATNADPGRVKQKERDLRASVAENFAVNVSNLHGGGGINRQGVLIPVAQEPVVAGELQRSISVAVEAPYVSLTPRRTIGVSTYIKCDYGAICTIESATMVCSIYSTMEKREYKLHLANYANVAQKGVVEIATTDPSLGQNCEIFAVADVTGGGTVGKFKSYSQYFQLLAYA